MLHALKQFDHKKAAPSLNETILDCENPKDLFDALMERNGNNWTAFMQIARRETKSLKTIVAEMQEKLTPEQIYNVLKQTTENGWNVFMLLIITTPVPEGFREAFTALLDITSVLEPDELKTLMTQQSTIGQKNALLYAAELPSEFELINELLAKLKDKLSERDFSDIVTLEMMGSKASLLDYKLGANLEEDILTGFNRNNIKPVLMYAIRHRPDWVERILAKIERLDIEDWNEIFSHQDKNGIEPLKLAFDLNHEEAVLPLLHTLRCHLNWQQLCNYLEDALSLACATMPQCLPAIYEIYKSQQNEVINASILKVIFLRAALIDNNIETLIKAWDLLQENYQPIDYNIFFSGIKPGLALLNQLIKQQCHRGHVSKMFNTLIDIIQQMPPEQQAEIFEIKDPEPLLFLMRLELKPHFELTTMASRLFEAARVPEVKTYLKERSIQQIEFYDQYIEKENGHSRCTIL